MNLNLDSQAITLTCPGCGKEFDEKIGWLKNNPTITCPSCKQDIAINADDLRAGIKRAEKILDDFRRSLSKLGK